MAVTRSPHDLRIVPTLLAMIPLPIPDMTPPVTRMYFIVACENSGETKDKKKEEREERKTDREVIAPTVELVL